jgi:hypothetical protein
MAAPHVAGLIALMLTNGTELSYEEVSEFLFERRSEQRHLAPTTAAASLKLCIQTMQLVTEELAPPGVFANY